MLNILEAVRHIPNARKFEIGDMLFARFSCPNPEEPSRLWSQTDHLVHLVNSGLSWKTASGSCSASAGESVFFKKGAYAVPPHAAPELCFLIFFIPDHVIKQTVRELAEELPPSTDSGDSGEIAIRVKNDAGLMAFLQAMALFFSGEEEPPAALLRLKLKELLTTILLSPSNPLLAAHFRSVAARAGPLLGPIMEANFHHHLSLEEFARLCHRSLSSFKRDFRSQYGISPGKWLLERRLQRAASLLRNAPMNITEVMLESGFQDASHFCHVFKQRFGEPPGRYRQIGASPLFNVG
jgi:AraC-like DNA-binding protein